MSTRSEAPAYNFMYQAVLIGVPYFIGAQFMQLHQDSRGFCLARGKVLGVYIYIYRGTVTELSCHVACV